MDTETDHPEAEPADGAREGLERELYWAEEATARGYMSTGEVRDALHDFAILMRDDQKQVIPRGEPNLASRSAWRRRLKVRLFRLIRPISWRYDRLSADLAELTAALADRVAASEAELARLRKSVEARGDRRGTEGHGPGPRESPRDGA